MKRIDLGIFGLVGLVSFILLDVQGASASFISVPAPGVRGNPLLSVTLGDGFDSGKCEPRQSLLNLSETTISTNRTPSLHFSCDFKESHLESIRNTTAEAGLDYWRTGARLEVDASYRAKESIIDNSLALHVLCRKVTSKETITNASLLQPEVSNLSSFGDSYVYQVEKGGAFEGHITITSTTREKARETAAAIRAAFNNAIQGGDGHLNLSDSAKERVANAEISCTVAALQNIDQKLTGSATSQLESFWSILNTTISNSASEPRVVGVFTAPYRLTKETRSLVLQMRPIQRNLLRRGAYVTVLRNKLEALRDFCVEFRSGSRLAVGSAESSSRMSDAEALQVATKALDAAREEIDSAKDDLADLVSVTCTSSEMESFAQRVTGIMTNAIQLAGKEFRISELTDADLSDPRVLGYIVKTKELKRTIRGTPSHINCSDGQTIISPGRMNVTAAIRVEKMREVILDASANYKSNPGDAYGRSSDWNGSLMGAIYEAPENAVVICKDLPFQNTWSFTQYGISDQCRVDKSTDKDHDLEKLEFIQVQLQGKNGELVLGTLGLPVYTVEWEKGAPASSGPSPMGRAR